MKKSIILIIIAILVMLGCLVTYNLKVKANYETKTYKNRFNEMDFTSLGGIENLNIKSANLLGIQIEQGDHEGIWISRKVRADLNVMATHTLNLGLTDEANAVGVRTNSREVIIMVKKIRSIITTSNFKGSDAYYDKSEITVKGYHLDRLDLEVAPHVIMYFTKMQLHVLNATVGSKVQKGAKLVLFSDNRIDTANLNVFGKSALNMQDPQITKANYKLSDSATVTFKGKVLQAIK